MTVICLFIAGVIFVVMTNRLGWSMFFFNGIMSIAVAACVYLLVVAAPTTLIAENNPTTSHHKLANLNDGQKTSGSFFLGTGSIGSDPAFFFYQKSGRQYILRQVYAANASVIESKDTPQVAQSCTDYRSVPDWIVWPLRSIWEPARTCGRSDLTTFYVPPGTVKSDFSLDAQ